MLRGEDQPKDNAERLTFAQMAYDRKHFAAAARLWAEALASDPKLGDDRQAGHRYNAACAAALAAAGQGKDEPPPDDAAKAKLRRQALDWLKAELTAWTKLLESGPPQARPTVVQTLQHWKRTPTWPASATPRRWRSCPRPSRRSGRPLGRRLTPCTKKAVDATRIRWGSEPAVAQPATGRAICIPGVP